MDLIDSVKSIGTMAGEVFDPNRGKGWTESVVALILCAGFIATLFIEHDNTAQDFLQSLISLIVGIYFGQKNVMYKKEREPE